MDTKLNRRYRKVKNKKIENAQTIQDEDVCESLDDSENKNIEEMATKSLNNLREALEKETVDFGRDLSLSTPGITLTINDKGFSINDIAGFDGYLSVGKIIPNTNLTSVEQGVYFPNTSGTYTKDAMHSPNSWYLDKIDKYPARQEESNKLKESIAQFKKYLDDAKKAKELEEAKEYAREDKLYEENALPQAKKLSDLKRNATLAKQKALAGGVNKQELIDALEKLRAISAKVNIDSEINKKEDVPANEQDFLIREPEIKLVRPLVNSNKIGVGKQSIGIKLKEIDNDFSKDLENRLYNTSSNLKSKLIKESIRAGNIVLATQLVSVSSSVISKYIVPFVDKSDEQNISNFLQSEFGKSLISLVLGIGLTKYKDGESYFGNDLLKVSKVAEECRINGMANAGSIMLEELFENFIPMFSDLLNTLPKEQVRVTNPELDEMDNFEDEDIFIEKEVSKIL